MLNLTRVNKYIYVIHIKLVNLINQKEKFENKISFVHIDSIIHFKI